jgi:hypothetical protein
MSEVQHFPIRLAQIESGYGAAWRPAYQCKADKALRPRARSVDAAALPSWKGPGNPKQCLVKQPREFPYISRGKPTRANRRRRQPDYQLWSERGDS